MALSSYSTYPLEDVAAQGTGNPYAIQMCVLRDRSLTLQLLERAESREDPHSNQFMQLIILQRADTRPLCYQLMCPSWAND